MIRERLTWYLIDLNTGKNLLDVLTIKPNVFYRENLIKELDYMERTKAVYSKTNNIDVNKLIWL